MSLGSRIMSGTVVDAVGERVVILSGIVVIVATTVAFVWAPVTAILLLRSVQGIGWGFATAAIATVVYKTVPETRRGEGSGYYALTVIVAVSLTPLVAILLMTSYHFVVLLVVSAGLASASMLLLIGGGVQQRRRCAAGGCGWRRADRHFRHPGAAGLPHRSSSSSISACGRDPTSAV